MKLKKSLKRSSFAYGVAGTIFSLAVIFFVVFNQNNRVIVDASVSDSASVWHPSLLNRVVSGLPVHLKIPKINVDAAIESVGTTSDGSVGVPKGPTTAAWFDLGPRPGEEGSSVIDGHFGWKDGIHAVFDDLYKLTAGDKVFVEDDMGSTTVFVVRESRLYGKNEGTSDVFSSNDGTAHLNLITCEGVWSATAKSYSNRLVVFADEEI